MLFAEAPFPWGPVQPADGAGYPFDDFAADFLVFNDLQALIVSGLSHSCEHGSPAIEGDFPSEHKKFLCQGSTFRMKHYLLGSFVSTAQCSCWYVGNNCVVTVKLQLTTAIPQQ